MKFTVFYSWQSDLPSSTNRGFIRSCLEKAADKIRSDVRLEVEVRIDHDTLQVPGAPDIADTIFSKIEAADCYVADVSLVTGKSGKSRLSPNPNVLIELGYAVKALGWERIILVSNSMGYLDADYPFDLRGRRRLTFKLAEGESKEHARGPLVSQLKRAFEDMIYRGAKQIVSPPGPELEVSWLVRELSSDGSDFMLKQVPGIQLKAFERVRFSAGDEVEAELRRVEGIDGSQDPRWDRKIEKYRNQVEQYLEFVQDQSEVEKWQFWENRKNAAPIALRLSNTGSTPAENAVARVELPEWILAASKVSKVELPSIPSPPVPRPALATRSVSDLFSGHQLYNPVFPRSDLLAELRPSFDIHQSFHLDAEDGKKVVTFSVKRVMHKHSDEPGSDEVVYLWALPSAPKGTSKLKAMVFCEQYPDYRVQELDIEVV